jgi:UDP-glucose 4-epimerase
MADVPPELLGFLMFGRGIDTTRMRTELGFEPAYTTEQAFADFATGVGNLEGTVERLVEGLASSLPDAGVVRG